MHWNPPSIYAGLVESIHHALPRQYFACLERSGRTFLAIAGCVQLMEGTQAIIKITKKTVTQRRNNIFGIHCKMKIK